MDTQFPRKAFRYAVLSLLLIGLLTACGSKPEEIPPAEPTTHPIELTAAVLQTENAELIAQVTELAAALQETPPPTPTVAPTFTSQPTLTPTAGPTISVPEGLETVSHATAPNFVFAYDPELWRVNDAVDPTQDFLVNRNQAQCKVNIAPAPAPETLFTYFPDYVGRRGWLVQQDADNTFYQHQDLTVQLLFNENDDCLAFQEDLLQSVYSLGELSGAPAATPIATPTLRPTADGFVCEGALPPRLEQGDRVLIITGALWLRSEARVDEETELQLFTQFAPAEFTVTGDPVCVEGVVYFPVSVQEFGPTGELLTGWMAESGNQVYYLDVWYLGW